MAQASYWGGGERHRRRRGPQRCLACLISSVTFRARHRSVNGHAPAENFRFRQFPCSVGPSFRVPRCPAGCRFGVGTQNGVSCGPRPGLAPSLGRETDVPTQHRVNSGHGDASSGAGAALVREGFSELESEKGRRGKAEHAQKCASPGRGWPRRALNARLRRWPTPDIHSPSHSNHTAAWNTDYISQPPFCLGVM